MVMKLFLLNMNKKYFFYLVFGIVLITHLAVRVVGLESSPASVNWDEASLGYSAYSLLKTGKDEYGNVLPVALRSFNDYKPALYSYLSMIPIYFMGLNQVSVRVVSVVAGTVSLIALWLIINFYLKNKWFSLLMVGLLGFGPLRLHFSRVALESNLSMCFFSFGIYFWLRKLKWATVISLILAMLSYHSARLAGPALIVISALDPIGWLQRKPVVAIKKGLLVTTLLGLALVMIILTSGGGSGALTRLNQENLFTKFYPFVSNEVFTNDIKSWVLANPIYYLGGMMLGHLTANLSPANFGPNIYHWIKNSVQFVPGLTMLGFWETLLFLPGLVVLVRKITEFKYRFLVYVILATATPAIVTWNWFHTLRTLNMLPILELAAVLGLSRLWQILKRKQRMVFVGLGMVVAIFQVIFLVNNELVYAPVENSGVYQPGGFKAGIEIIKNIESDYDQIIIDTPHANTYIFFLFYNQYPPEEIQKLADRYTMREGGDLGIDFGKYQFRRISWGPDQKLKRTILWMGVGVKPKEVAAVGGRMWLVPGVTKEYAAATIVALP